MSPTYHLIVQRFFRGLLCIHTLFFTGYLTHVQMSASQSSTFDIFVLSALILTACSWAVSLYFAKTGYKDSQHTDNAVRGRARFAFNVAGVAALLSIIFFLIG